MKLYLVQHGIALPEEQDPKKPLSKDGKDQTEEIAAFLKKKGMRVERIWHSRKARSIETAHIISEHILYGELVERDGLNPNDPADKIAKELQGLNEDLMIVGHLPFLQRLASSLLTGLNDFELLWFKYSGVVCLERQEGWKIAWFLTPDLAK